MPVKKQLTINFHRPARRGVLHTRVTLQRRAVHHRRTNPLILHRIENFRKLRITGDVPSLKRFIYERKPNTALGKGLHGAAKNAYRIYRAGKLPGKIAWSAGLAGEALLYRAGGIGVRYTGSAVYQKVLSGSENDTSRALTKTLSGAGRLLLIRRQNRLIRKEVPRLRKDTSASKRRLKKSAGRFKSNKKPYKKQIRRNRRRVKKYRIAARNSPAKSRTRIINRRRGLLAKQDYKLSKKTYKSLKIDLKYARKIHRENKRLLKFALSNPPAVLVLAGEAIADKISEAASENDTTAVAGAAIKAVRYVKETRTQKLYSKQERLSKLKSKSAKNTKAEKLRQRNTKLYKKGADAKPQNKKRRKKPKKGFKSRVAAIVSSLSKPGEAIKSVFKGVISKAAAVILIPVLPFLIVGFMILAIIVSLVPQLTTAFMSTYQSSDEDIQRAFDELKSIYIGKLTDRDHDVTAYYVDDVEKTQEEMYSAEFLDPHMLISYLSVVWFMEQDDSDPDKGPFKFTGGFPISNESKVKGYINDFYNHFYQLSSTLDGSTRTIEFYMDTYDDVCAYIYNNYGSSAETMFKLMYSAKGNKANLF